jgi:hypothetical protein
VNKNKLHQNIGITRRNRYPDLFDYCSKLKTGNMRIMSFGCSIGLECKTLKNYFPESEIVGIDIKEKFIKVANRMKNSDEISYDTTIEGHGTFDFIFALSVLCKYPQTKTKEDCSEIYPFSKFEKTVIELSNKLNKDGYLVIYNSNFKITDTSIADSFEPLSVKDHSGDFPKFNKDNKKSNENYPYSVFKKIK